MIPNTGGTYVFSSIPIDILVAYKVGVSFLGAGAAFPTVDIQSTEFTVYVYDSAGNGVERNVNLEISGY